MVKYKEAANVISFQLPVEVARRLELQGHCSLSVSLLCLVRLEERELLLSTHLKRLPELWSSLVSTLLHILAAFQRPHFFFKKRPCQFLVTYCLRLWMLSILKELAGWLEV